MLFKISRFVKRVLFISFIVSITSFLANGSETKKLQFENSFSSAVAPIICHNLDDNSLTFNVATHLETIESAVELWKFYKDRQCHPAWSDENKINSEAIELINRIRESEEDGLDIYSTSYHLQSILNLLNFIQSNPAGKNNPIALAQLDFLLTDAYIMLGKHFYYGLVSNEVRKNSKKQSIDMTLHLKDTLQNKSIQDSLNQLLPSSRGYSELKKIMIRYLQIQEAGGWKKLEVSYVTDGGSNKYSLDDLKNRLRAEGDLANDDHSNEGYENALKNFQQRHGIMSDGIVGRDTLSKLDISLDDKISLIRLNLERWRERHEYIDRSYVLVNIPDFTLSVVDEDKTVLKMKAILGKVDRPTPIISGKIKYIVINPYWRIPNTIFKEDILPKVQKDIRYLKKEKIRIFKVGDYSGKKEINPRNINWNKINVNQFPYILRQDTGPKNVLGRIKFMFTNSDDIYIHDTPVKNLFEQNVRLYSSGCIRIQEPMDLANYLLEYDDMVGNKNISDFIASGKNKRITFSKSLRVYIDYWTVWVDEDGIANFRDDVYGHDMDLAEILGWTRAGIQ